MLGIKEFFEKRSVDEDFDEVFYQKQYPETKNFYQPFCIKNNISDRQRLFYHYIHYGSNLYKNLKEFNKDQLFSKISKREKINNKLAVVTCLYNPCGYLNIYRNYEIFFRHMNKQVDLYTIELSFDGNFYSDLFHGNTIKIKGNNINILWQKERLLNMLINKLPKQYTDVAWIDSDIIFDDPYWVYSVYDALSKYKVVQLFDKGFRQDAEGNKSKEFSSIVKNLARGVSGYAWAARREVIKKIKLLDNQILGGADFVMCSAFMDKPNLTDRLNYFIDDKYTKNWINKAKKEVDGSVSFLNQSITHLYHGSFEKRNYTKRYGDFLKDFSFRKDVSFGLNGLWYFKNEKKSKDAFSYFLSREEDDNIINVNSYFDNVYVLNLDKQTRRMEVISKKLNKLRINFQRFSALDGDSFEFENPDFVEGVGDIENKYGLACSLSHANIIKDAKEKGYKKILIFEDDVLFCDYFDIKFQKLKSIPKDWKLIYLGGSQHNWSGLEYSDDFYFSRRTFGCFAYAIDSSLYDEILILSESKDKIIDYNICLLQEKYYKQCYTIHPNICIADVSESLLRKSRDQSVHNEKMKWNIYNYS